MSLRGLGIAVAVLLLPAAAQAGPPGSGRLLSATVQCVRFVHDDAPENGTREPGEITPCTEPVVDESGATAVVRDGASGPRCIQATVGALRGLVTLIADDSAQDNDTTGGDVLALLFEIRSGDRTYTVADAYSAVAAGGSFGELGDLDVGWWDGRLGDESTSFRTGFGGASFLFGGLAPIRARLLAIGNEVGLIADPAGFEPVVVDPSRDGPRKNFERSNSAPADSCGNTPCGLHEVDESGSALATVAQYRVTLQFAEKTNPGSGPCSVP